MAMNLHRPGALLALFAAAVLVTGLLTLVGAKPASAEPRSFLPAPGSPLPVGSTPTTVTDADFNGDGEVDLAAQNSGSNSVSVLLGKGDGAFDPKRDFAVGSAPASVASADLDGDTRADLAVANWSSNNVSVLLGNGDGTFKTRQNFAAGASPSSVTSADFNGDGKGDLATANYASNTVSVLLGNGDGTFQAAQNSSIQAPCTGDLCPVTAMAAPNQVIAKDLNADGKTDLATANFGACFSFCQPGGISVLLGNGNGTFQNAKTYPMGTSQQGVASSVATADFNADGGADLAVTIYNSNVVSVLRGNGDGTFSTGQNFTVGTNPSAVTGAHLDGDTSADLAVSSFASDNVSVLFNSGSGGFRTAQNFPAGDGPIFVIGSDLGADSHMDLAVANQKSNNVSVLLNTAPPPETTITGGPSGRVASASATFEFSSSEPGSTFRCALDNPSSYNPCTSPQTYDALSDGSHTFYVKATGAAGNNTDPTPATRTWTVDTTAPAVSSVSPADQAQNAVPGTNVEATFSEGMDSSTLTANTFTLEAQGSSTLLAATVSYNPTTKKATLDPSSDLASNTTYTATIKGGSNGVKDLVGHALQRDYSWTFTAATPPETTITSGPSGTVDSTSATFEFSSSAANSTFRCRVSGGVWGSGNWSDCQVPWNIGPLPDASYTFEVYAIDSLGVPDPTPASQSWRVNTTGPTAPPTVASYTPTETTNQPRDTRPTATFSTNMDDATITAANIKFQVYNKAKKKWIRVARTVSYDADSRTAEVTPGSTLAASKRYRVTVTTDVRSSTGVALDQSAKTPGNQPKSWTFTTGSR